MNAIIEKEKIIIEDMIYEVRGVQVMLSSDVAKLYHVETKVLNQTIKRNINRFPSSFCFQLTNEELDELSLRSQFVTLNKNNNSSRSQNATLNKSNNLRGYNIKYLPYVLTEQGIMMLSGLLKSDIAVKVNIEIIDAFVKMRRYFANNINNNQMLINHENRLLILENTLDKFKEKEVNKIFFENELYDAYSLLMDIFDKSNKEIIIIDNYAGKELLDILKNIDKKIIIVSKNIDNVLKNKYELQYDNVTFINNDSFHDRFIIIDRKMLYSSGASLKDLGKKCFGIHELNDMEYLNRIIKTIGMIR